MPLHAIAQLATAMMSAAMAVVMSIWPVVQHGTYKSCWHYAHVSIQGVVSRGESRQDITELPDLAWHTVAVESPCKTAPVPNGDSHSSHADVIPPKLTVWQACTIPLRQGQAAEPWHNGNVSLQCCEAAVWTANKRPTQWIGPRAP